MAIETGQIPSEIINVIEDLSSKIALKDGEKYLLSRLAIEFTAPKITETPELKEEFLRTYAVGFTTFDFVESLRELLSRLAIEFTAPKITETPELKEEFLRTYAVGFTTFDFVESLFDEHLAEPYALLVSDGSWVTPDVKDASVAELTKWLSGEQEEKDLRAKLEAARQEDIDIANDLGWSTPLA